MSFPFKIFYFGERNLIKTCYMFFLFGERNQRCIKSRGDGNKGQKHEIQGGYGLHGGRGYNT